MSLRVTMPLVLALIATGCESRVSVGARCAASDECPPELRCLAGRCRPRCVVGRDCEAMFTCVLSEGGEGACAVAEDRSCEGGCVAPLVCLAGECVQPCDDPSPCAPGLGCVEGHCARVPTAPCDLASGAGCETGRRCELGADGEPSCRAITVAPERMRALHEPCTDTSECETGLACFADRCMRPCVLDPEGSRTSCGAGRRCARYDEAGAPAPSAEIGVCTQPCDPIMQTGCTVGAHVCVLTYDSVADVGSCRYTLTSCDGGVGAPACSLGDPDGGCGVGLTPLHFLRGRGASGPIDDLCFELCADDADCDAGFRCYRGASALDLETTEGTLRRLGACVPACEAGACVEPAISMGLACEPTARYCTSACDTTADCGLGLECRSGRCTPPA